MRPWWHNMVGYRVDIRLFRDSDGDGIGDLEGLRDRLGYLNLLGVDNLWLTGLLATPVSGSDGGRDVDPVLGGADAFDALVAEAHERGIGVGMDLAAERPAPEDPGFGDALARSLRFWAGRGVDGFRVGVTPGMTRPADEVVGAMLSVLRPVADAHGPCLLGAVVDDGISWIRGLDQLDMAIDARLPAVEFDVASIRGTIDSVLADFRAAGAYPVWSHAHWSRPRMAAQFGRGPAGLARARAMALLQLGLPGVAGMDTGDELGIAERNTGETMAGLPARSPMPWTREGRTFGFTEAGDSLPTPEDWQDMSVEAQLEDTTSTLSLYREAIELRRTHRSFTGETVEWYGAPPGCLAFRRGKAGLTCALNTSPDPVDLPGGEVLLSSGRLNDGRLPPNTAVWLV